MKAQLKAISAQIIALQKEHSELDDKCRKQSREAITAILPKYNYEVVKPSVQDEDSFRILRTLTNYQVYQDIIAKYGHPTFAGFEDKETVLSVSYKRKNGIVTHSGGGWMLLDEPFACLDYEWLLLKGNDATTILNHLK